MSSAAKDLSAKFTELARWERRKRHEEILLAACCAALGVAIVILPLNVLLPHRWLRWLIPMLLFLGLAPALLFRRRWVRRDEARAVAALDKELRLEERALTAWDLAARGETGAAAQLVFQQAEEKIHTVQPRALFPRRRAWTAYLALPLFGLWFTLLWLDFDRSDRTSSSVPQTLAQKAREFSREFQEKAKNEGLRESLKMGQELEKTARRNIENNTGEEQFKRDLAALAQKFDEAAKAKGERDAAVAAESRQTLRDLQAELAAARDLPELPELPKGAEGLGRQWADRLASMPQLKRRLNEAEQAGQGSSQRELKAFLDQLDRRVAGELDRRALLDAQQYLQQMMKQGQAERGENFAQRHNLSGNEDAPADGAREQNPSNLPGKEPGEKGDQSPSLPDYRAGPSTQVKGTLGAGESTALSFKAKPEAGKSAVAPAEVVASYRRQAEQELNSERVPTALKDTIKNYFLSLGDAGK